jgi:predicted DNA-binding transcriptional regulator AlpA
MFKMATHKVRARINHTPHPFRLYRVGRLAKLFDVDPSTIWKWYAVQHILPPPISIGNVRGWTEPQLNAVFDRLLAEASR